MEELGVEFEWDAGTLVVHGRGLDGLRPPKRPLDCGNSGTTMRLLSGLLAAQSFDSVLVGDASLMRRPMERVAEPLRTMGAQIELRDGRAPISIKGGSRLTPVHHTLQVPSAQVKSAIILAALSASGSSTIVEPLPARDHTERMLGLQTYLEDGLRTIAVTPKSDLAPLDMEIPGDFSSAAFFVVAATIVPDSDLTLEGLGLNPTRTALLDVLLASGAAIHTDDPSSGPEPVSTLHIQSAPLGPLSISPDVVPRLVDEVPVLAVAATQAAGESRFYGVGELRAKESDRIETTSRALAELGASVTASSDSMTIRGGQPLRGCRVESQGDHRIAMAMAVAGLVADGSTTIGTAESVSVSYPDFWRDLDSVTRR
jgi:3-phosphoshikimate 1-carboxyvinyltransferase